MESAEEIRRSARTVVRTEDFESEENIRKYNSNNNNKWTPEEQKIILKCLKIYGHKAAEKIIEVLTYKTVEDVRHFLLLAHGEARKNNEIVPGIKYWLERSKGEMKKTDTTNNNCLYMPAQIMKYLSIDGLLENHPKPECCGEVDFMAAYRLIYQALMGYPLQPVNQATADFISENFNEIISSKNSSLINELTDLIRKKFTVKEEPFHGSDIATSDIEMPFNNKKPLIVYKRKRPLSNTDAQNQVHQTPFQVVFKEKGPGESENSKFYSVTIKGNNEACPVAVPVPAKITKSTLESAASSLWENAGFNPLGLARENVKKHTGNQI